MVQYGKDLTRVQRLIGVGGIFAYGRNAQRVLEAGCFDVKRPELLRPQNPDYYTDARYILYAIGLLSEVAPLPALRIMKKHLIYYDHGNTQAAFPMDSYSAAALAPWVHAKKKTLEVRGITGAIRYFDPGNVPIPPEVIEYHGHKIAEREQADGIKAGV